jgi:hypothetical protein
MQEWDKIKAEEAAAAAISAPASTAAATPRIAEVDGIKAEAPTRQPEQQVALAPPDNKATS